jgi:hypothetical protein
MNTSFACSTNSRDNRVLFRSRATAVIRSVAHIVVAALFFAVPTLVLHAETSGIWRELPHTPFAGGWPEKSDSDIRFQLVEKWGEIKISEKLIIPIHVIFSPAKGHDSPILGRDWQFALFDSTCGLTNGNDCRMYHLNGEEVLLKKTKDPSVWKGTFCRRHSCYEWTAKVIPYFITVKSNGWTYTYFGGRLRKLTTPNGDTLDFIADLVKGGHTLNLNGQTILSLRPDFDKTTKQKLWHLDFPGKHAVLKMGKRPFSIETSAGKTGGKTETDTLVSVKFDKEEEKHYAFQECLLNVASKSYKWQKKDGVLIQNGETKFSFPVIQGIRCFKQLFPDGKEDIFGQNPDRSEEVVMGLDKKLTFVEYLKNTKIEPKIRKVFHINSDGQKELVREFWYDSDKKVVKTFFKKDGEDNFIEKEGNSIFAYLGKNREFLWRKTLDGENRLVEFQDKERHFSLVYSPQGKVTVTRLLAGKEVSVILPEEKIRDILP